ncbi:MAG: hypothetical protein RLZZ520_936 [Bacteroidota bacterium]|jgi:hypothetical protein
MKNLDWIRIIRYVLGGYLLVGGILQKDYTVLIMGAIITTMAIFNVGCFGGQCAPKKPVKTVSGQKTEEVTFEEVL